MSIIVPILNGSDHIPSIVEYLGNQTFGSYEVLMVVSSKSSDGSLDMVRRLTKDDNRVRVIEYVDTEALGGSKNMGIEKARGKYLWFLDVDDVPSPRYLEEMVRIKEKYGADLVGCNFVYSNERSPLPDYEGDFKIIMYNGMDGMRARATERYPVTSWSMLYDAEMIRSKGMRFPAGICEDIVFTYTALMFSKLVCYYEKPLYKYVYNPSSITKQRSNRDIRGMAELSRYDYLEDCFRSQGLTEFFPRRFTLLRVRSAGHMSYTGFVRYVRSDRFIGMVSRNGTAEAMLAFMFPTLYYLAINLFFVVFYYRQGRAFTGGFFEPIGETRLGGGGE